MGQITTWMDDCLRTGKPSVNSAFYPPWDGKNKNNNNNVCIAVWDQFPGTQINFKAKGFRHRPKFGFRFGYGAETDLTYGFVLVSATAKVHRHKFGFGRNIKPKPQKWCEL